MALEDRGGRGERQALVEALVECCADRGYEETTVAEVLAVAGCSRAAFDREFRSKEECAVAAVETILTAGMATIVTSYSGDTSERESAIRTLKALLELFAERPALARLAFIDPRQSMPASARERYEAGFSILTAMLDRLRGDGADANQAPPTAARAAIGGGEALVRRELASGHAEDLPRRLPDLVYGATVPFLGQEEALRLVRLARELRG